LPLVDIRLFACERHGGSCSLQLQADPGIIENFQTPATSEIMSQQVSPQVDVGGLSLRGLSAFSSILATLSTDDVAPAAMLQMERLGSFFPINGPKAAKVPDLL
jgi:hypothetical protein